MSLPAAALLHGFFEWLAIAAGAALYLRIRGVRRAEVVVDAQNFPVLCGCLLGAAIGNKAVFWIENPQLLEQVQDWSQWIGGQSMVGGLLGGLVGVEFAKKLADIRRSTGDAFVFPLLLGLIIGRVGCFLAGLADQTYGVETDLPWGVDFGDGVRRHPTQLYEILFAATMWAWLTAIGDRLAPQPGLMFKLLLVAYLLWRLLIDTLKPVPYVYPAGLSGIQWVCLLALIVYTPLAWRQWRRLKYAISRAADECVHSSARAL